MRRDTLADGYNAEAKKRLVDWSFAPSFQTVMVDFFFFYRDLFQRLSTNLINATPEQLDEYYVRKRMKTLFDLADTDGSGTISLNELYTLLESGACLFT